MEETRKDKLQLLVRRFFLIVTDIVLINGSIILALVMRFDVNISLIEPQYIDNYKATWILFTIITLIIFWFFRMSKCFIVSIRIVDSLAVSLVFSTLRIAIVVLRGNVIHFLFTEQR